MKALVILYSGFEEMEATVPIVLLRRNEIDVTIVSCNPVLQVKGGSDITLIANELLDEMLEKEIENFDCLVIPGGFGYAQARHDKRLHAIIRKFNNKGKLIAAICAAPVILKDAGILNPESDEYTCHPCVKDELFKTNQTVPVVINKNIITSRGPGTAFEFAFAIVSKLKGESFVENCKKWICYSEI